MREKGLGTRCAVGFRMSEETPIATPTGEEFPVKFDARLAEGVAYFEQMLEIMPDDRTTLEFLVVAYDMLGQHEKGQKALVSLAELLVKEHDLEALKGLLPRLEASDYAPAKALFLKVSTLTAPTPDLTPERPKELTESEKTEIAAQEVLKLYRTSCNFCGSCFIWLHRTWEAVFFSFPHFIFLKMRMHHFMRRAWSTLQTTSTLRRFRWRHLSLRYSSSKATPRLSCVSGGRCRSRGLAPCRSLRW